jgi:hypothetical protein
MASGWRTTHSVSKADLPILDHDRRTLFDGTPFLTIDVAAGDRRCDPTGRNLARPRKGAIG